MLSDRITFQPLPGAYLMMFKMLDKETTEKGKRIATKSGKNINRIIGYNKGFKVLGKKLPHERIKFIVDLSLNWNDSVEIDIEVIDDKPTLKKIEYRNQQSKNKNNVSYIQTIVDSLIKNWE